MSENTKASVNPKVSEEVEKVTNKEEEEVVEEEEEEEEEDEKESDEDLDEEEEEVQYIGGGVRTLPKENGTTENGHTDEEKVINGDKEKRPAEESKEPSPVKKVKVDEQTTVSDNKTTTT